MNNIRARLQIAIALLLFLSAAVGTARATPAVQADTATWTPIVTLPVGDDAGQVGYRFHVEGAGNLGPQALAVRSDGTLYLLDSVHQRVHVIANGTLRNTIALPFVNYPSDILAADDNLYILDDNRVLQVSYTGALVREYPLPPGLAGHQVYRLVAGPNGRVFLWTAYYRVFELDHLPAQVDLEAGVWQKQRAGRGIASPGGNLWIGEAGDLTAGRLTSPDGRRTIEVAARGVFGSMRLVGFERGRSQIYMLVEDLYDDNGQLGVELTVRRYHPDGQLTGVARLPNQDFVVAPRRPVELAADGALYAMVPAQDRVTIYRVELGQSYQSRIPERGAQNPAPALSQSTALQGTPGQSGVAGTDAGINTVTSPLSRRTARTRAEQIADTVWTWHPKYDKFSNGDLRPSDAWKPSQLNSAADGAQFTGIPYNWGGFDSPWTHTDNQPWTNWNDALGKYASNGPLVGKTNAGCNTSDFRCDGAEPRSLYGFYNGSAGIDCSGFIGASASVNNGGLKPGTGWLGDNAVDWGSISGMINQGPWNLQPLNFFVGNTHTFYYDYGLSDASGFNTLEGERCRITEKNFTIAQAPKI